VTHPRHRGPHPADHELFADERVPALRTAVDELSWLLGRGYGTKGALKLVGDRHSLRERQRLALRRSACREGDVLHRAARRVPAAGLANRDVLVDGFNCLITVEAALSGGVLLRGREGALRDLASVHGSYRQVDETMRSLALLGDTLAALGARHARWLLDRPVSNSGRLRGEIEALATERGWPWTVELQDAPDRTLAGAKGCVVASSDGNVLDRCEAWIGLPELALARAGVNAWVVQL
jgi:hypothetical protein